MGERTVCKHCITVVFALDSARPGSSSSSSRWSYCAIFQISSSIYFGNSYVQWYKTIKSTVFMLDVCNVIHSSIGLNFCTVLPRVLLCKRVHVYYTFTFVGNSALLNGWMDELNRREWKQKCALCDFKFAETNTVFNQKMNSSCAFVHLWCFSSTYFQDDSQFQWIHKCKYFRHTTN